MVFKLLIINLTWHNESDKVRSNIEHTWPEGRGGGGRGDGGEGGQGLTELVQPGAAAQQSALPHHPAPEAALGGHPPRRRHVAPWAGTLISTTGNGNRGGVSLHTRQSLSWCPGLVTVTLSLVAGYVTHCLAPAQGVAHPEGGGGGAGEGRHRQVGGRRHTVLSRDVNVVRRGVLSHASCRPHQPGNVGRALVVLSAEPVTVSEMTNYI